MFQVLEMARQKSDSGEVTSDSFHQCLLDCGYRSIEGGHVEIKDICERERKEKKK